MFSFYWISQEFEVCVFLYWIGLDFDVKWAERLYEFTTTGIEEGFFEELFFECQPLCSIVGVSPSHYY